ncbi:MAG: CinA family protein [Clostridia bacterium]|nr:CinA family protein [Clostridia bacterium]
MVKFKRGDFMLELCTKIVDILKQRGLTLSTAESCTGGLVAKSITDVSGCSSVFYGGVVSYDNSVKQGVLGVKEETLNTYGAVSYETAREMAQGVRRALNTDIGISTTGIAGPGGGTPTKPVGTVYIGIATSDSVQSIRLNINENFSRSEIRAQACYQLLKLLLEKLS